MASPKILFRVIFRALRVQPGLLLASLLALTVGATLASAFLFLYFELPRKMTAEFRSLGPNLVLTPQGNDQTLPEGVASQLAARHPDVPQVSWLYAVGKVNEEAVIFGGTDLAAQASLNPGWKVLEASEQKRSAQSLQSFLAGRGKDFGEQGGWMLAGEKAATRFDWHRGEKVHLAYGERGIDLPLTGILSTGGSEDSQLLLGIQDLQTLTDRQGQLSQIQLAAPGPASQVEEVERQLAARFPQVDVRPLRQVVDSEARIVLKVRGLMFGLTAIVLGIVVLTVMTRVSGMVLNRRREIGVMKALGGSDGAISLLFVGETACLALVAAAVGTVLGFALAQEAVHRTFHSALQWRWDVLPAVVAVTLAVTLAASVFPVRLLRRLEPALILRGN